MKTLSITALLFICTLHLNAQNTLITGTALDERQSPAVQANAILYAAVDSSLVKVEVTDLDGKFQFLKVPAGRYWVKVSYVGYEAYRSEVFELVDGQTIDLGTFQLQTTASDLDEVVVTAERPILELEDDKMVFNIENSLSATGSNGMELLRKSPGVLVDNNNNITILGRTGVRIFIDGRPSPLRGADLNAYLESLQSTDIDAIEIITNPGAKYEAEGNAGIINIRLKKEKGLGTNGSVTAGYQVGIYSRYNLGTSLNHRTKKVNIFGNYSMNLGNSQSFDRNFRRQRGAVLNNDQEAINDFFNQNLKAGLDLFLSPKSTLGFLVNGSFGDGGYKSRATTEIGALPEPLSVDSLLLSSSDRENSRTNVNFNVNYQLQINQEQTLNLDLNYGFFDSEIAELQPNQYVDPTQTDLLFERINRTFAPRFIDLYSLRADYSLPFWGGNLGTGINLSYVKTDNDFDFFNVINGTDILDTERTNRFLYEENINAAYFNFNRTLSEKISVQLGLRMEHTHTDGELLAEKETDNRLVQRDYINWFPSASLNYTLDKKNLFQLSFSRRIKRPSYQNLNPFEFKQSELSFRRGNPFLQPEYSNSIQLRHSHNYRINTTLAFSHTTDIMLGQVTAGEGNEEFYTWLNLADQYNYSLNIAMPISITSWWSSFSSITAFHRENRGDFGEGRVVDETVNALNIYAQQTFKLPNDISMELSGFFNTPSIYGGNLRIATMWGLNFGFQKVLFDGKATLRLALNDMFRSTNYSYTTIFGVLDMEGEGNHSDSRRFQVNFTYLIGNKQVKKARNRDTGLEDKNQRIGG
jgi:iron complex outermembrane receptor protein